MVTERLLANVILSPSLVILSEAKNLCISLRVNSAKNLALRMPKDLTRLFLHLAQDRLRLPQNDKYPGECRPKLAIANRQSKIQNRKSYDPPLHAPGDGPHLE